MKHLLHRFTALLLFLALISLPLAGFAQYEKLERGTESDEVLNMQLALQSLGYSLKTDGKYGADTQRIVKQFQRKYGLSADGVAGDKTLTLLYSLAPAYMPGNQGNSSPQPTAASNTYISGTTLTAQVTTPSGSLNLRSGPSSSARVISTIPYGDMMIVVSRGSTWCSVIYNGKAGFVMTKYLTFSTQTQPVYHVTQSPTATPRPTYEPMYSANTQAMVTTTGGSLNLREVPEEKGRVITTIPYGAWVTVAARGNTWCQVAYNGVTGYVMSRYLSFGVSIPTATPYTYYVYPTQAPTALPVNTYIPAVSYSQSAWVATPSGSLNLRESPDSGARVIATIPYGAQITVLSRGVVWCSAVYNGMQGYVMTSFLRFADTPTAVPTAAPTLTPAPTQAPINNSTVMQALVTTSGGTLNLREQPSSGSRVILLMPNASSVTVYSRGTDWCEVSFQGTKGYVMTKYLTFLGASTVKTEAEDDDPSVYKRTLKKGMTGADVAWVQSRLMELGYSATVTNVYDDATFAAVKAFQQQNGLDADGSAGSQTFVMLKSGSARRANAAPLTYSTVRIDQSGSDVKKVQTDLKALGYPVSVTGEYDTDTHNAVVAFQQRNGLVISGIADALTRQVLHGGGGKPYSTPVETLPPSEGRTTGPALSQLKLLHWQKEIKPNVRAGQTITIFDPNTNLSWKLVLYSLGNHADSQPATWKDTQIMNRSFGDTSWTIHPVYVMLPDGQWTMATMHNRPHLYGSITDNGFGGHLCVHFLRDMSEAQKNDPNYGVNNQVMLRNAWKTLTGETVN
ncbi:MAG: peptidoglycan-binding protein [Clostridia bacterium]|nr:peptidoglycan-binding protein [Clostridia bacterium]